MLPVVILLGIAGYLLYRHYGASQFDPIAPEYVLPFTSDIPEDAVSETTGAPATSSDNLEAKTQELMLAIAHAEGFGADPNNVPTRSHNPGDLGPGDCGDQYPFAYHSGSNVSVLPDDETGWALLHNKVFRMLSGQSRIYSPRQTFTEVAQRYAGDWRNWAKNVTAQLGVTLDTTLQDWLQM